MMRRGIQSIMHKSSVILLISSIAISAIICAPQIQQQQQQQQQQLQQNPSTASSTQQQQHQTSASVSNNQRQQASSTASTPSDQASIAPSASVATGQPSSVPLSSFTNDAQLESSSAKSSPQSPAAGDAGSELDIFDGKSPFTDDSLWQIPFQMVGDMNSADEAGNRQSEPLTNSASETSSLNDNDDDEEPAQSAPIRSPHSASAAAVPLPAEPIESALAAADETAKASDLKTAAGYHYPTHGGHHQAGGHHGGSDYHGGHGYFQYVNVPKPKAYEFGYKRGNSKHTIERYEKKHGPHFQTKVKWSDKHGHGVHTWDYNHGDHYSHHGYDDDSHHGHHDYHQKKYQPKKHY